MDKSSTQSANRQDRRGRFSGVGAAPALRSAQIWLKLSSLSRVSVAKRWAVFGVGLCLSLCVVGISQGLAQESSSGSWLAPTPQTEQTEQAQTTKDDAQTGSETAAAKAEAEAEAEAQAQAATEAAAERDSISTNTAPENRVKVGPASETYSQVDYPDHYSPGEKAFLDGDMEKAKRLLEKEGTQRANLLLGFVAFHFGSEKSALTYFEKVKSDYDLARLLIAAFKFKENTEEANKLLDSITDQDLKKNIILIKLLIAFDHETLLLKTIDKKKIKLLEQGSVKGVAFARAWLGWLYIRGIGVEKNYNVGFKTLMEGMQNGFPLAYRMLALLFINDCQNANPETFNPLLFTVKMGFIVMASKIFLFDVATSIENCADLLPADHMIIASRYSNENILFNAEYGNAEFKKKTEWCRDKYPGQENRSSKINCYYHSWNEDYVCMHYAFLYKKQNFRKTNLYYSCRANLSDNKTIRYIFN